MSRTDVHNDGLAVENEFINISNIDAESRLVPALDRLALAQSFVSFTFDEADYPDSPNQSYDELRKLVSDGAAGSDPV